jgi:hypothetical protein
MMLKSSPAIRTVSEHFRNIFDSKELDETATLRKIWRVQQEGNREVSREIEFYNLDAIISVGYRVNSTQATQFRIWATQTLREFVIKGFVLDDERLKLNKRFGRDYFDELLERIREIRASERQFYLKITDIYQQCSIDYRRGYIMLSHLEWKRPSASVFVPNLVSPVSSRLLEPHFSTSQRPAFVEPTWRTSPSSESFFR